MTTTVPADLVRLAFAALPTICFVVAALARVSQLEASYQAAHPLLDDDEE